MDKGPSHTEAAQERPYPSTGPSDRNQEPIATPQSPLRPQTLYHGLRTLSHLTFPKAPTPFHRSFGSQPHKRHRQGRQWKPQGREQNASNGCSSIECVWRCDGVVIPKIRVWEISHKPPKRREKVLTVLKYEFTTRIKPLTNPPPPPLYLCCLVSWFEYLPLRTLRTPLDLSALRKTMF